MPGCSVEPAHRQRRAAGRAIGHGRLFLVALALLCAIGTAPASADAIDGSWCHDADSKRISIDGPTIVTPGGARIDGDYHRHAFSYVVPPAEPAAGGTVTMELLNETTVRLTLPATGMASAQEQIWRRCGPPISRRERPGVATG